MKKLVIHFSLCLFSFALCKAQDTLVFKNGDKLGVKISVVLNDAVEYTLPPDEKQFSISLAKLDYIKYKDGSKYSIQQNKAEKTGTSECGYALPNYHPITIDAGIGLSTMELAILVLYSNEFVGPGAGNFINQSPAFNGTVDYAVLKGFTLGIGGAYQWVTDNPYAPPINNVSETWAVERISRCNISLRAFYQFLKSNKMDFYLGIRVGESFYTDKMLSNNPPDPYVTPVNTTFSGDKSYGSIQGLLGVRVFPFYTMGFHAEFGIGTPYLIEGGLSFRFKTKD
jgi:hypothetical protein